MGGIKENNSFLITKKKKEKKKPHQSLFLTTDCKHEEMRGRMDATGEKKWKRISCKGVE
jgi:hypothetical protein